MEDEAPYGRSAAVYDLIYEGIGKDYAAESAEVLALVRARRPEARTLLDVACGTGGHLVHLRGDLTVEGVERSTEMAERARARLPGVTIHPGDMRTFRLPGRFDAVTCLFSSIGYTRTPADLQRALTTMARHLEPGGVLVVDGWVSPERWLPDHVDARSATGDGVAVARTTRSWRVGRTSVLEETWLIATPTAVDRVVERHELGLFTAEEVGEALVAAGGVDVEERAGAVMGDRSRWVASVPVPPG